MLPANLINSLQALARSERPLIAAATDAPNTTAKFEPGQQFQATVQSKISEGLFRVQIAGQTIQMRLPGDVQTGEVLKLEVITNQPKITFGMVASTNPLSTPEQIGSTAQILSNLVDLPIERQTVQQLGGKAVWPAEQQAPDAKLLAAGLREALGNSGLFYEAHQEQWIRGERSTDQLLQEPQNVLTGKSLTPPSAELRAAPLSDSSPSAGETPLAINKELLPLVQQQLHTLEHHHLAWMGQVWPGQQMQWEVQGEPEHQSRPQDERQWSTEMELTLPRLGGVHAHLTLVQGGLQLTLHASDPATAALFTRALPTLADTLAAAGIPLAAAVVEKS